jgi:hypothetical protein
VVQALGYNDPLNEAITNRSSGQFTRAGFRFAPTATAALPLSSNVMFEKTNKE